MSLKCYRYLFGFPMYLQDIWLCLATVIGFIGYAVNGTGSMRCLSESLTWFGEILKGVFMTKFHLKITGANGTIIYFLAQLTKWLSLWNGLFGLISSQKVWLLSVCCEILSAFGFLWSCWFWSVCHFWAKNLHGRIDVSWWRHQMELFSA